MLEVHSAATTARALRAPRVSVVIPAFRAARLIERALTSVAAQTFRDFETIVVDDGSPDGSALREVLRRFPGVRYLRRGNGGPAAARNSGIVAARGEYVAFLDADDEWQPTFLADQCARLDRPDRPDLVYCDAFVRAPEGDAPFTFMTFCPSDGEADFASLVLGQCVVLTSSVVARRSALVAVGLFDESMRRAEDYQLWLRLARGGARIVFQRLPLVRRNMQVEGLSQDTVAMTAGVMKALGEIADDPAMDAHDRSLVRVRTAELRSHLALHHGKVALHAGDGRAARAHLEDALRFFSATDGRRARKLRLVVAGLRRAPTAVARVAAAYGRLRRSAGEPRHPPHRRAEPRWREQTQSV